VLSILGNDFLIHWVYSTPNKFFAYSQPAFKILNVLHSHFEPAWKQRGYEEMDKGQGREKGTEEWVTGGREEKL
jgi:hypothetical protein